jgi:hypothetical protein
MNSLINELLRETNEYVKDTVDISRYFLYQYFTVIFNVQMLQINYYFAQKKEMDGGLN